MNDFVKIKDFDYKPYYKEILAILKLVDKEKDLTWTKLRKILSKYPKDGNKYFSKEELVSSFYQIKKVSPELVSKDPNFIEKIRMKPIRSQSGVTVVTVLTKPFPCPGQCIFCPNDIRMPKSYLSNEPGAQRAEMNNFDPYLQTFRRLKALNAIGHNLDKIEVIILGGTWSFYPESYQIWFIKRIFEALNDFGEGIDQTAEVELKNKKPIIPKHFDPNFLSKVKSPDSISPLNPPLAPQGGKTVPTAQAENKSNTLQKEEQLFNKNENNQKTLQDFILNAEEITKLSKSSYNTAVTKIIKSTGNQLIKAIESASWEELELEQIRNEKTKCRCVGLVIETRPDKIDPQEVIRIRRLGCTKTQIGFQSLQDEVLDLNKRGHKVAETRYAVKLLRQAGFKIHAHWMANLYGSSPEKDIQDYKRMFQEIDFKPDELKIYPCSLIETAELMDYYEKDLWKPYNYEELLEVLLETIKSTPEYCRLTRIIRDIPGTDIVVGNKITNFRQVVENEMDKQGLVRKDIRSREIKNQKVTLDDLQLSILPYQSQVGTELFLQFETQTHPLTDTPPNPLSRGGKYTTSTSQEGKNIPPESLKNEDTALETFSKGENTPPNPLSKGGTQTSNLKVYITPFEQARKFDYNKNPFLKYDKHLKELAKEMRKKPTPAEKFFWNILRKDDVLSEFDFDRQKPIGRFIVDFYCRELKLVIEIDGDIHNSEFNQEYDKERGAYLKGLGLTVLRFSNDEILNNINKVLKEIVKWGNSPALFSNNTTATSTPPLERGQGGVSKIAGFLRLSLPNLTAKIFDQKIIENDLENLSDELKDLFESRNQGFRHPFLKELDNSAIIREVHIYGKVVQIGNSQTGKAQHLGLGKKLINKAVQIAKFLDYPKLAVISAIGTREYYQKQGFERNGGLYQVRSL